MGIGAVDIETSPDDHRGIKTCKIKNGGCQRRGCGLAVGTGNGHARTQTHQLGQHFGTGNNGQISAPGLDNFRIVVPDGRGFYENLHIGNVLGTVTDGNPGTQGAEMLDHGRIVQVGTADLIAKIQKNFGYAAHACSANADHVDLMNFLVHPLLPQKTMPAQQA